jgi:hypothetical protein
MSEHVQGELTGEWWRNSKKGLLTVLAVCRADPVIGPNTQQPHEHGTRSSEVVCKDIKGLHAWAPRPLQLPMVGRVVGRA